MGGSGPDSWYLEAVRGPRLHPLVVAAGQGLVSVLALVVFQAGGVGRPRVELAQASGMRLILADFL